MMFISMFLLSVSGPVDPDASILEAGGYQRRSKRLRRRMATAFMMSRNTKRTMIAPDARSTKAGSPR
jgi:hypothetical protein